MYLLTYLLTHNSDTADLPRYLPYSIRGSEMRSATDSKPSRSRTWLDLGTEICLEPVLDKIFFGSQNNTADKTNGVNNAVSLSTVQCFLCCYSLPVFDDMWNGNANTKTIQFKTWYYIMMQVSKIRHGLC